MNKDEYIFSKLFPNHCWHEFYEKMDLIPSLGGGACTTMSHCKKCHTLNIPNPDFTSWDGFGMLLAKMQEREDWEGDNGFQQHISGCGSNRCIDMYDINPSHFRDTVFRWLGGVNEVGPPLNEIDSVDFGAYDSGV